MPYSPCDSAPLDPDVLSVGTALDPVLIPLGFAEAQPGASDVSAQVISCRGVIDGGFEDSCVDLVIDLEASPDWRITDVRYWGFPSERWHLSFGTNAGLSEQLRALARTLPQQLA